MNPDTKNAAIHSTAVRGVSLSRAGRRIFVGALGAIAFAGLTFLGANIRIPLQPVPITLQTMFVLLSGALVGSRCGTLSQVLYVGAGLFGLPVFAGAAAGLAVLTGPTGGYLAGFVVAPLFVGRLIKRSRRLWWQLLVFYLGSMIILALGVIHLSVFYTHDLKQALGVGYLPFIPGDVLKILAATSIYRSTTAILRYRKNH
jgi:biotin transport system substrate-specific component